MMKVIMRENLKESLAIGRDIRYPNRLHFNEELGQTRSIALDVKDLTQQEIDELISCHFDPSRKEIILKEGAYFHLFPIKIAEANIESLRAILNDRIAKKRLILSSQIAGPKRSRAIWMIEKGIENYNP